ncbi:putative tetratricopeptide-like helical domain superfamily [Arabidopsis thaliana]|uniref:Tetratricopeptide repeat (TPR)-like superfamily protein n=2 Tax=Arabidopsis TaxID=3701 RepID=A0A178W5N8_ARATH|nr:Tetratricopeptide-like helical domain superfamily [Arabidopsis thaliana x Arabidopsis arenosa]OAP12683.1 hypothetical protein AXX17_AT1G74980 [Arabidopsis thaliana]
MLLRSTSAPILNSWLPQHCSRESSPEPESQLWRRSTSLSLFSSKSIDGHTGEQLHQALSDNKENIILKSKSNEHSYKTPTSSRQRRSSLDETRYTKKTLDRSSPFLVERLFSSSGQGDKASSNDRLETLVSGGGGGMGGSGGNICNGGGGVGGSGVDGGRSEDATDTYYREMIDSNPGNSLLTGNYAKFLKEVKGDMKKAEEYCERAILGNTNDGNVLSLYADLILHNHQDRQRAHSYYKQAVKMSPEDCYVQASYARFLWDVDEDEEDEALGEEEENLSDETGHVPPTTMFRDFPQHTSITASS